MIFDGRSDRGKKRGNNEDSYGIVPLEDGYNIFIVADGMGGHNSGEIASRMAVDHISEAVVNSPELVIPDHPGEPEEMIDKIAGMIKNANRAIFQRPLEDSGYTGMGTTVVVAVVKDDRLHLGHVGDSRAYLIHQDTILQLTADHSYVEELVRNGTLRKEEAKFHPQRNLITRALGTARSIQVDVATHELAPGDFLLLCTDGLTNMLEDEEIKNIIIEAGNPEVACRKLVEEANGRGGDDNITVITVRI